MQKKYTHKQLRQAIAFAYGLGLGQGKSGTTEDLETAIKLTINQIEKS